MEPMLLDRSRVNRRTSAILQTPLFERAGIIETVLISGAICAVLLVPLVFNRYFYFSDDYQSQFMPMFVEIARQLKHGMFPLFTEHAWHGGAIVAEYQYAVFNPICLALYLCLDFFPDVAWAAAFYAIVHYFILAAGTHILCLSLRFTRPAAAVGAVLACSSTWLLYWGAQSWIAALVSISWVPWCLAALVLTYHNPKWLPAAAVATALPLLSGWPFTTASLAVLLGLAFVFGIAAGASRERVAWAAAAAGLGGGLALPAILPTFEYLHSSARTVAGVGKFAWRASVEGLLSSGLPTFIGPWWSDWDGPLSFYTPSFFYFSWFALLALANMTRVSYRSPDTKLLMYLTGAFVVLSASPAIWQLRWSFRYLPFVHLLASLLIGSVISNEMRVEGTSWRWRAKPSSIAIWGPCAVATVSVPGAFVLHFAFSLLASACAWLAARALVNKGPFVACLLGPQAVFFFLIVTTSPTNTALPSWQPPTARVPQGASGRELSLFAPLGNHTTITQDFWANVSVGNRGLFYGRDTINGYTPVGMPGLDEALCLSWISASCPDAVDKLFVRDAETGQTLIDLLDVTKVVAQRGVFDAAFGRAATSEWHQSGQSKTTIAFSRDSKLTNAIAWASPGISVVNTSDNHYEISSDSNVRGGKIIFSKAWYPGYSARLNGERIEVRAYRGMLPEVDIPSGARGRLVLTYWPAGLTAGLIGAGCSTLILALFLALGRFQIFLRLFERVQYPV
jgi:hypothetical protein